MKDRKEIRRPIKNDRGTLLSIKQVEEINRLYWEEGWQQPDLAAVFNIAQGQISRLVNALQYSYQHVVAGKYVKAQKQIIPAAQEAIQAKVMRAKRETLPATKLTWKEVSEIRRSYFAFEKSQVQLAKRNGVNQSTISRIISSQKWKRLK